MRRTFWQQSPLVSLWDAYYKTPLLDAGEVPVPSEWYKTNNARARLLAVGLILPRMNDAMSTAISSGTGEVGLG